MNEEKVLKRNDAGRIVDESGREVSMEGLTTGWHYANEYNSTKFTDCCGVASNVGESCPRCGREVV